MKSFREIPVFVLADSAIPLPKKHLEMVNKCSQLVGSENKDLFQGLDTRLQQLLTKPLSLTFSFAFFVVCSFTFV